MASGWIGRFWARQKAYYTLQWFKELLLGFLYLAIFAALIVLGIAAGRISLYVVAVAGAAYILNSAKHFFAKRLARGEGKKLSLFSFHASRSAEASAKSIFWVLIPFVVLQLLVNNQSYFDFVPFLAAIEDVSIEISHYINTLDGYGIQLWLAAIALVVIPLFNAVGVVAGFANAAAQILKMLNVAFLITCFTFFGVQSANLTSSKWHFDVRHELEELSNSIENSVKQTIVSAAMLENRTFLDTTFSQYVSSLVLAGSANKISKEALRAFISDAMPPARAAAVPLDELLIAKSEIASVKQLEEILSPPTDPHLVRSQLLELRSLETAAAKQAHAVKSAISSAISLSVSSNVPGLNQRVLQVYIDEIIDVMSHSLVNFAPKVRVNAFAAALFSIGLDSARVHLAPFSSKIPLASYERVLSPLNAGDVLLLKAAQNKIDTIKLNAKSKPVPFWKKIVRAIK